MERRARRVLFSHVEPAVRRLPHRASEWIDALPAQSTRERAVHRAPTGGVDWVATRLRGWPPTEFVATNRRRVADELLTSTATWTLSRLLAVRADAVRVLPGLDGSVARQLAAADEVVRLLPPAATRLSRPTRLELSQVRRNGRFWTVIADIAEVLRTEDADLERLARQMVLPDDDLRWRLFHLGCLGAVLHALEVNGCTVRWLRPLTASMGDGPAYRVEDAGGRHWDLWFEAAGIWRHYGRRSPYRTVRAVLPGAQQPLGADLALIRPGEFALLVECKYSSDPSYVGRNGYEQTLAYMAEAATNLCDRVAGVVVGPDGVVTGTAHVDTAVGSLAITSPSGIPDIVRTALRADNPDLERAVDVPDNGR